jgi:hypothetical protein
MGTPASVIEQSIHEGYQEGREKREQAKDKLRDAQAGLLEETLSTPGLSPQDRQEAMQRYLSLYQPHEAPGVIARLSGLIHGQKGGSTPPTLPPQPPQQMPQASGGTPTPQQPIGDIPHPFAQSHPLLDKMRSGLASIDNHLKGFANPNGPAPPQESIASFVGRTAKNPEEIKREDAATADAARIALAKSKPGSVQQQKLDAGAKAAGFDSFADAPGDDQLKIMAKVSAAGRAPQKPTIRQNPADGRYYTIAPGEDGQEVATPLLDNDGKPLGGFKPNTVTKTGHVYHFIGEDNQVHEVPYTTETEKIFGPSADANGKSAASQPRPMSASAKAVAEKLNNKKPQSKQVPVSSNAPQSPSDYASGKTLGPARLGQQDRGVLEADSMLQDIARRLLPNLEPLKNMNSLADRARVELAWQQYQAGFEPSDKTLGPLIKDVAMIGIAGAAPWVRLGRNKYQFQVIEKHLPHPSDTPKLMYDKIKWLNENVIPSSQRSILNSPGKTTGATDSGAHQYAIDQNGKRRKVLDPNAQLPQGWSWQ